jgi:hypothetical protein
VEAALHYKDGEVETVELSRIGTGPVIVNQPPDSTHTVDVTLLDPLGRYEKVTVQFAKGGDDEPATDRTIELVGNAAHGSWSFRPEGGNREYRYRPTYFLSGPVREEPWTETAASQLLVGDRIAGVLRVEVVVLGAIESGGFRALRLRLRYPDAPDWADEDFEKTIVSGGPVDPIIWEVPMTNLDNKSYEVELQWFRQDGERRDVGPVTSTSETLLIDPNTGEVL